MSKIIQIKTPATSANLGPGFDFFGIALSLYNVIQFEEVDDGKQIIEEIGFQNVGENLCKKCFEYIINKYCKAKKHYIISLIQNDIPVARGLGSSASAIVSGMVGANYFINNMLDESQLIDEMVNVEGHPDNILPCYLGGAVSSIYTDKLNYFKYNVNKDLYFNVLIPKYKVSTADARGVLPNNYQLSDVVFNSSRVMLLPKALESGDIDLLKIVTDDKIHEPYRKQFIKEYDEIAEIIKGSDAKLNISGSGPTMLLISKSKDILTKIRNKQLDLEIYNLSISNDGVKIKE